ncbi:hypothetical protein ACTFIY_000479 [Dictyostelium cf. discoideum]
MKTFVYSPIFDLEIFKLILKPTNLKTTTTIDNSISNQSNSTILKNGIFKISYNSIDKLSPREQLLAQFPRLKFSSIFNTIKSSFQSTNNKHHCGFLKCNSNFDDVDQFSLHIVKEHPCDETPPGSKFFSLLNVDQQIEQQKLDQPTEKIKIFACTHLNNSIRCTQIFNTEVGLIKHYFTDHLNDNGKSYKIEGCLKEFQTHSHVKTHFNIE